MLTNTVAATRCGMPADGSHPAAFAAVVSAYAASPAVAAFKTRIDDASNGAQGASDAWSPPV